MKQAAAMCMMCTLVMGCAGGSGDRAEESPDVAQAGTTSTAEIAPGPMMPAVVEAEDEQEIEAFEQADPASDVKRESDDLLMRRDGRPSWWFGEIDDGGGRMRVCAEALSEDMLGAKRGAIEAGRARIREALGVGENAGLSGERVERAWVWPLPHAETPGARYAGYVLLSVDRE